MAAFADGVIVGSAFVRRLLDDRDPRTGVDAVRELAAELADGVRRGSRRGSGPPRSRTVAEKPLGSSLAGVSGTPARVFCACNLMKPAPT